MKTVSFSVLAVCFFVFNASGATTITGTSRTLTAYSSGYAYLDPFAGPEVFPRPVISIEPDPRSETVDPGTGASTATLNSRADYVGTGQSRATADISAANMTVSLFSTAGHATGGFPPGPSWPNNSGWSSSASAMFRVEFRVDSLTQYQLSGSAGGFSAPVPRVSISSVFNLTFPAPNVGGGDFSSSGILQPGTYTFETFSEAGPVHPSQFSPSSSLTATLLLIPIPEPGCGVLALAGVLFAVRRSRRGEGR